MTRFFVAFGLAMSLITGMAACHSSRDQFGDDGRYRYRTGEPIHDADDRTHDADDRARRGERP